MPGRAPLGWLAASSGDTLVLVSQAAAPDRPHLVVYRPAQRSTPVVEAELRGPPDADLVAYGRGTLVVANQDIGKIAVYTDR